MKRLLLMISSLVVVACLFIGLKSATMQLRTQTVAARQLSQAQTQLVTQAQMDLTVLEQRVHELNHALRAREAEASQDSSSALFSLVGAKHLSAAQSEQLLAALGFNWASNPDFVVVSKESLDQISVNGIKDMALTGTAAAVLAVKPEEKERLDTLMHGLATDYEAWARSQVQRGEPNGEVVAKYTMPSDSDFSQSLSNRFTSGVMEALGAERGNLLIEYAWSWMNDLNMLGGGATTMTLKSRATGGDSAIDLELKSADGGSMYTTISPYQPFPAAFRPLFPNGWADIVKREGFALPPSFEKK
jgi:hypothetical protein